MKTYNKKDFKKGKVIKNYDQLFGQDYIFFGDRVVVSYNAPILLFNKNVLDELISVGIFRRAIKNN